MDATAWMYVGVGCAVVFCIIMIVVEGICERRTQARTQQPSEKPFVGPEENPPTQKTLRQRIYTPLRFGYWNWKTLVSSKVLVGYIVLQFCLLGVLTIYVFYQQQKQVQELETMHARTGSLYNSIEEVKQDIKMLNKNNDVAAATENTFRLGIQFLLNKVEDIESKHKKTESQLEWKLIQVNFTTEKLSSRIGYQDTTINLLDTKVDTVKSNLQKLTGDIEEFISRQNRVRFSY